MREHLYSMSVVIVIINGGMDNHTGHFLRNMMMTELSESYLAHLKTSTSAQGAFSNLNPRGSSFRIYRHVYFDSLKRPLATTNSSSVSTSFSSCIALRSPRSFGYQTNIAFACLLKFFGMAVKDCVSNHK